MHDEATARLLITCSDQAGVIASVSSFLHAHGANITALDQHSTDPWEGRFFMRLEFQTPHLDLSKGALQSAFQDVVASRFGMEWSIDYAAEKKKTAILVSKYDHALLELLWRWRKGELPTDVCLVISNHPDLEGSVRDFGVPFHHIPVEKGKKAEAEAKTIELLEGKVDLVVMARYMQILSEDFIERFPHKIINIHHSFLPAFIGANPYRRAFERGVKLIGATAHYATKELDEGPIIDQDVARVNHRHSVKNLVALGRDLERIVLSRAVPMASGRPHHRAPKQDCRSRLRPKPTP